MNGERKSLVIGIGGHVVALDPGTGSELWRTKLKSSPFVTVTTQGDAIFAGAGGELWCLDPATGAIRWHNALKGLGLNVVGFAGSPAVLLAAIAAAQAAAAVAASSG